MITYRFAQAYLLQADLKRHGRDYNLARKEIVDLQKQVNLRASFFSLVVYDVCYVLHQVICCRAQFGVFCCHHHHRKNATVNVNVCIFVKQGVLISLLYKTGLVTPVKWLPLGSIQTKISTKPFRTRTRSFLFVFLSPNLVLRLPVPFELDILPFVFFSQWSWSLIGLLRKSSYLT